MEKKYISLVLLQSDLTIISHKKLISSNILKYLTLLRETRANVALGTYSTVRIQLSAMAPGWLMRWNILLVLILLRTSLCEQTSAETI